MSLSSEAVEIAARSVLKQLAERLHFSKEQVRNDEVMECLQFGICNISNRIYH
ncbi:hypothetical protein [Prochlorococcus sp. MIT 1223]|uniref:hypothetical protein n=1 Tax=Prochlorococcus sp. MIT 1223 TaxID=3096217 RepID=UPI002A75C6A0|nr:hypothetical protein [Prochlorococcus sp. MIT 1223]